MNWWNDVKVILKTHRDIDRYVGWSTICNDVVWVGTRAEALRHGVAPGRLDRAEATGTSFGNSTTFGFEDPGLVVAGRWWLPRHHLDTYAQLAAEDADQDDPRVQQILDDPED